MSFPAAYRGFRPAGTGHSGPSRTTARESQLVPQTHANLES